MLIQWVEDIVNKGGRGLKERLEIRKLADEIYRISALAMDGRSSDMDALLIRIKALEGANDKLGEDNSILNEKLRQISIAYDQLEEESKALKQQLSTKKPKKSAN